MTHRVLCMENSKKNYHITFWAIFGSHFSCWIPDSKNRFLESKNYAKFIFLTTLNFPCKSTLGHNFLMEKHKNSLKTLCMVFQDFTKSNFSIFGFQKFSKISSNIFSEIYIKFYINTQIFVLKAFVYAVQEWKHWFCKNVIIWLSVEKVVNFFNKINFSKNRWKFFPNNKR